MQFLLDTHSFLWFADDDPRLSASAKKIIQDPLNFRWLSSASIWEMAIKLSINKLTVTSPLKQFMAKHLPLNMVQLLPITIDHLAPSPRFHCIIATHSIAC